MDALDKSRIFNLSAHGFEAAALDVFRFQQQNNPVYREYLEHLKINPDKVNSLDAIPFLPIDFFKTHEVRCMQGDIVTTFLSSGTTGMMQSKHHVTDISWYEMSFLRAFEQFYGPAESWVILALLPAYLEREGSSLIYMADKLISKSTHTESGFYLYNHNELAEILIKTGQQKKKVLLLGVSFALLDFSEHYTLDLSHVTVMETGGMKGRRKEMVREELHSTLQAALGQAKIHSEYGMTELLSQAYSQGNGKFNCPPWMRISTRPSDDPLGKESPGKTGGINIIDLANRNSCSFIATQDLGKVYDDGSFEILGRFDNSDVRGCNLLVVD